MRRKAVVVGASSGVGRALAERLAREGFDIVIVARDGRDLECVAADLGQRLGARVVCRPIDITAAEFDVEAFCRDCLDTLDGLDALFLPAGQVSDRDEGLVSGELLGRLVRVNFTGPIDVLAPFVAHFKQQKRGDLVLFSTIAAAAPRGRNMAYAAAKAGLEFYSRALRHHLDGSGVNIQVYALGYVDTAMSFGQSLKLPVAKPAAVADEVVRHLGQDRGVVYYPSFWRYVTLVLRHLPYFLSRRLRF